MHLTNEPLADAAKLDAALERAAADPAAQRDFYELFLRSNVFVLAHASEPGKPKREGISPISWARSDGVHVTPLFTSVEALSRGAPRGSAVALVSVRTLLKAAGNRHLHVNPNSPDNLTISPEGISALLALESEANNLSSTVIAEGETLDIGQSTQSLSELKTALIQLFISTPIVEAAYLFEMHYHEENLPPRSLMVGIVGAKDKSLADAIKAAISNVDRGSLPINLCFIAPDDGVLPALVELQIEPFTSPRRISVTNPPDLPFTSYAAHRDRRESVRHVTSWRHEDQAIVRRC